MVYWYVDYIVGYRSDVLQGLDRRYRTIHQWKVNNDLVDAKGKRKDKEKERLDAENLRTWLITIQEHILMTEALVRCH